MGWRIYGTTATYAWLLWILYRTIAFYFFPQHNSLARYQRSPRAYALITGATGGIGYALAQSLVQRGFGVVIVARNKDKLAATAEKLRSKVASAVVEILVLDAGKCKNEELDAAVKSIQNLPITIVINNVGALLPNSPYRVLSKYSAEDIDEMINVNARFMTQLSRAMIPILSRNGRSLMLHLSSLASVGVPYLSVYCASKAYNTGLSISIAREAKADGIELDSLSIIPGDVHSDFNNFAMPPGAPTSEQYAEIILNRVEMAIDRNIRVMIPYWFHAFQFFMFEKLPERVIQYLSAGALKNKAEGWEKLQTASHAAGSAWHVHTEK